eukprot:m.219773 g.219773  ORF g.219773 m.219773 type:complete len:112 (-) comp15116_c1_seq19:5212-5547(-)
MTSSDSHLNAMISISERDCVCTCDQIIHIPSPRASEMSSPVDAAVCDTELQGTSIDQFFLFACASWVLLMQLGFAFLEAGTVSAKSMGKKIKENEEWKKKLIFLCITLYFQ